LSYFAAVKTTVIITKHVGILDD